MKANNYIKQLKEIVNNNVLESIECVNYGVQVYGISAVFDRLFPPLFNNQKPVSFVVPFTFWYRIIKDMRK